MFGFWLKGAIFMFWALGIAILFFCYFALWLFFWFFWNIFFFLITSFLLFPILFLFLIFLFLLCLVFLIDNFLFPFPSHLIVDILLTNYALYKIADKVLNFLTEGRGFLAVGAINFRKFYFIILTLLDYEPGSALNANNMVTAKVNDTIRVLIAGITTLILILFIIRWIEFLLFRHLFLFL